MDISHKTFLITGAASGLGAATARVFAERGAKVILADRNLAAATSLAAEINGIPFECDVTDENHVQAMLDQLDEIHGVVNCAGIVQGARILSKQGVMPLSDFSRVMQINLVGTFNVMRLVAAKISEQDTVNMVGERGVIINTASVAAFEGQLGQVAYSASKGGVVAMTLPAARELSRFGIRVMTIAPGVMQTPMMAGMTPEIQSQLASDVPFPKQLGAPSDFGALCAHIVENSYLNGEVIRLDGALRLR